MDQPPGDRMERRKAKEREKIRARRESRATYDLPPVLRERMRSLAEEQGVPASQLVSLALLRFIRAWEEGEVPLSQYKVPSRSPRYDWNLVFPRDLLTRLKRREPGRK